MKGIKKFIPVLLATVFVMSSLTAISAFAQQDKTFKQDGLNATLTTDKTEYTVNEKINVTLKVENTNPYAVNNIQTEIFCPEGFESETEELKQDGFALEREKSKEQNAVFAYIPVSKPVDTGDTVTAVSATVAVLSFLTLALTVVKQKRIRQAGTLALVICLALVGTLQISAKAENGERSFAVENTVVYDGKKVTVKANVSYLFEQYRNLTVDGETSIRKVGETVSVTAGEAEDGMHFASWQALKGKVTFTEEKGLTSSFVMPDEDVELKSVYEINKYNIKVTCEGKGTVSPATDTLAEHGGSKKFTFTPDTGYHIESVEVDGEDIGEKNGEDTVYPESYEFKNVCEEHTLKVIFDINIYTIEVYYYQEGEENYFRTGLVRMKHGESGAVGYPSKSPYDGGSLSKVVVDDTNMGAITLCDFTNITGPHTIKIYYHKAVA